VPVHFPPCRGSSPTFTEFRGQGGLYPEDTPTGMGQPKWPSIGAANRRWISSHGRQRWPGRPCPKPRINLTRYHGVLACAARPEPPLARARHASQARERHQVHRQRRTPHTRRAPCRHDLGAAAQARLNGAAIRIDIEVCGRCGGSVRVIACIEDQEIIDRILAHLQKNRASYSCSTATDTTIPGAARDSSSFRWEGFQFNSTQSASKPLRNSLA
jgi:hypothetical protein